jgi:hypothetical protein
MPSHTLKIDQAVWRITLPFRRKRCNLVAVFWHDLGSSCGRLGYYRSLMGLSQFLTSPDLMNAQYLAPMTWPYGGAL